jgi:hypothetical protein
MPAKRHSRGNSNCRARKSAPCLFVSPQDVGTVSPVGWDKCHDALLADEDRTRRGRHRRRAGDAEADRGLVGRAQLPGAQLHARPDAGRRRRAVLPLVLSRAGHRRTGRSRLDRLPRPHPVRPKSPYYDPKSTPEEPRWVNVDVRIVRKTRLVGLDELRAHPELANMRVLQRGNRLSITPVDPAEWKFITGKLIGKVNK